SARRSADGLRSSRRFPGVARSGGTRRRLRHRMETIPMTHRLTDLSWEQFRARVPASCDLAIVPVGTIEAHGAIPLGTDTIIPVALAARLAPKWNALVAPAVGYGVTNSLLPYPGSTTVTSATFRAYLFEATAGLADAGFRRVVILNGHGGQSDE